MNKNMMAFAIVGAAVGILLAHFYPDLGLNRGDRFAAGLGRAFGEDKPYLRNAAIGAIAGVAVALLGKK